MKPRLCVYLSDAVDRQLALAARLPGASKSAITEAALAAFLSADGPRTEEPALTRRLDRMSRQLARLDRDQAVVSETLALFVRYYLTVTPPMPATDQDTARALGKERFDYFVAQLGRRLAAGKNLVRDVLEELPAAETDLFMSDGSVPANGAGGEVIRDD